MAGIQRIHGSAAAPIGYQNSFQGAGLNDFTITFASDITANNGAITAGGPLDVALRTAVETVGTLVRVGTLQNTGTTLRVSVEALGDSAVSPAALGLGNSTTGVSYSTTAAALQATLQAIGTLTFYTTPSLTASTATYSFTATTVAAFTY